MDRLIGDGCILHRDMSFGSYFGLYYGGVYKWWIARAFWLRCNPLVQIMHCFRDSVMFTTTHFVYRIDPNFMVFQLRFSSAKDKGQ